MKRKQKRYLEPRPKTKALPSEVPLLQTEYTTTRNMRLWTATFIPLGVRGHGKAAETFKPLCKLCTSEAEQQGANRNYE